MRQGGDQFPGRRKEIHEFMKRVYSLKENSAFQYVYRRGKSQANRELVLLFIRQGKTGASVFP